MEPSRSRNSLNCVRENQSDWKKNFPYQESALHDRLTQKCFVLVTKRKSLHPYVKKLSIFITAKQLSKRSVSLLDSTGNCIMTRHCRLVNEEDTIIKEVFIAIMYENDIQQELLKETVNPWWAQKIGARNHYLNDRY